MNDILFFRQIINRNRFENCKKKYLTMKLMMNITNCNNFHYLLVFYGNFRYNLEIMFGFSIRKYLAYVLQITSCKYIFIYFRVPVSFIGLKLLPTKNIQDAFHYFSSFLSAISAKLPTNLLICLKILAKQFCTKFCHFLGNDFSLRV